VVPIRVPPLRERVADVRPLAEYFLEEFCRRNNFRPKMIEEDVFALLSKFAWPGNARELRNVVERMAILTPADRITVDSVPLEIRVARDAAVRSTIQDARDAAERDHILRALEATNWNVSSAARSLGMERTNLHKRIRALGLMRR
jgi:two-component system nitrogen regulation response regulator NtrX